MRTTIIFLLLLTVVWVSPSIADDSAPIPTPVAGGYSVGVGDMLKVSVYDEPEMSGKVIVDADGSGDFPLIGRVVVAGDSTTQASAKLHDILAASYLRNPRVTVTVERYGSKLVKIYGKAKQSEVYLEADAVSLEDVLASASVDFKDAVEVWIRAEDTNTETVVNIERLLASGEGNISLTGGETIHFPTDVVVYVDGQVKRPSAVPFRKGMTVTQALTHAGGLTELASLRNAYILRENKKLGLNLKKILDGKQDDVVLERGDQVVVPESMF